MRVYDKTPFRDRQGNIGVVARAQGALTYGLDWPAELEAQEKVIAQLDRMLDKGYAVIRNFSLLESDILIPLILVGPGSISVIFASPVKGHFEARGREWNTLKNGTTAPARQNLVEYVTKLARGFQKYLEINNIHVPVEVEPVLICTDPGAQIEAVQPAIRIVRSDAVRQFANQLNQAKPVMRAENIANLVDRILIPELREPSSPEKKEGSPARPPAAGRQPSPARQAPKPAPQKKTSAVSRAQWLLLAGLGLFECCLLVAGAAFLFYFNQ